MEGELPQFSGQEKQSAESAEKSDVAVTQASNKHVEKYDVLNILAELNIGAATLMAGYEAWNQGLTNIDQVKTALLLGAVLKTLSILRNSPYVGGQIKRAVSTFIGPEAIINDNEKK